MDSIGWGILVAAAFLGLFGMIVGIIVFAAVMHAWSLLAIEAGLGVLLVLFLACGHEREPRERRIVQKGARWP